MPFRKTRSHGTRVSGILFQVLISMTVHSLNYVFSKTLIASFFQRERNRVRFPELKSYPFTCPSLKSFWEHQPEEAAPTAKEKWHYLLWAGTPSPSSPQLSRFIIFKRISFLIFNLMGFSRIQTPAVPCPCLLRAFNQRLRFLSGKRLFHGAEPKCPSQGLTYTH